MVGETIPFRREMIHHESFRASVLNHSDNNAVLHSIAAKKCLLTTPSLLSRGTRRNNNRDGGPEGRPYRIVRAGTIYRAPTKRKQIQTEEQHPHPLKTAKGCGTRRRKKIGRPATPCGTQETCFGEITERKWLHGEDGAEAGLALHHALICLRSLGQWVRLDYRFNFSLRHEIKGFVEIFGAVLLAADDLNALRDEVNQRDRKRFRVGAHNDEPAVRPQTVNAVHHGLGRIGSAEDDVGAARRGKALSVADNFVRAELADHLVLIGGVRDGDSLEARSLRVLHGQVAKPADSKDGNALVRLRMRPAEPAIDRVARTEDRRCLLVGNFVGNQVGG